MRGSPASLGHWLLRHLPVCRLERLNMTAILLVPSEDTFNWIPFIIYLSTVTAKTCAIQKSIIAHNACGDHSARSCQQRGNVWAFAFLSVGVLPAAPNSSTVFPVPGSLMVPVKPTDPTLPHWDWITTAFAPGDAEHLGRRGAFGDQEEEEGQNKNLSKAPPLSIIQRAKIPSDFEGRDQTSVGRKDVFARIPCFS